MKKRWVTLIVICALAAGALPAQAQDRPPTIFAFACDVPSVTVGALENGTVAVTLSWHVAHVTNDHRILLDYYQENRWVAINGYDNPLPPVGSQVVQIGHPRNFGPPTLRLSIVDKAAHTLDERTLVIPYNMSAMDALTPAIEEFTASTASVNATDLAYGSARVEVRWKVKDRLPLTNLVFEQMLNDTTAQNIELPRDVLWVSSSGTGQVAPVRAGDSEVRLRLRVVHVITGDVYSEATLTLPVTNAAPVPQPSANPTATTAASVPSGLIGDLVVINACAGYANVQRGWFDGPVMTSPDGQYSARVVNPDGDARLIITRADGSGEVVIDAPNKGIPLALRPRWSPDGSRIAFGNIAISQPGGGDIYLVNRDGSGLVQIGFNVGYYDDLAWSPDGALIYFTSGVAVGQGSGMHVEQYKVYAVPAAGGQPQYVTDGCAVTP